MNALAFFSGNQFSNHENYFFVLIGIIFISGGLKGVVTRKGRTRSKGGHVTHYSGKDAVVRGLVGICIGIALMIFGLINLI